MKFTVGGELFDLTRQQVITAMKNAPIETIQKHVVEIDGQAFPPKQAFAAVTGRARQSFTTMEAQRVLTRLGFVCRRAGQLEDGTPAWVAADGTGADPSPDDRIASLEAAVGTMQAAIAGLHARLSELEGAG
jgi:hypothetical protein